MFANSVSVGSIRYIARRLHRCKIIASSVLYKCPFSALAVQITSASLPHRIHPHNTTLLF